MQVALEIANDQKRAKPGWRRDVPQSQFFLAPDRRSAPAIVSRNRTEFIGDVNVVGIDAQPGERRDFLLPDDLSGTQIDADRTAVYASRVDVITDDGQISADIDESLELSAPGRRRDRKLRNLNALTG